MNTEVNRKVLKEVEKVPESIKKLVFENISALEDAETLHELDNIMPIEGTDEPYYRMKIRAYRLLIFYEKKTRTATVQALTHRKDTYKKENTPWKR
jgi:mRNA-degrading endonuclease RelE of RelBE toxin-antitoxin system